MKKSSLLFGGDDPEGLEKRRRDLVRNRLVPGIGILVTGGLVFVVSLLTHVWFLFYLTIPLMALGGLAVFEAWKARELEELAIYEDGVRLPLPTWSTGGQSFLRFTNLSRISLNEEPYRPHVDFYLRKGRVMGLPHYRLPKDFISEWSRFQDVLRRACTAYGVSIES